MKVGPDAARLLDAACAARLDETVLSRGPLLLVTDVCRRLRDRSVGHMAATRGARTQATESGDAKGEEGLVKGLGWPYQLSPGGAGGLGWPVPASAGRDAEPAENDQGQEQVASLATTPPAQDALTRDTRHVVSVVPGSAPGCHVPPSQSPPDHEAGTPSTHRVAPSILAGWGGAAPVVVQGGVFWPPGGDGIQVMVEEPLQTGVSRETPAILSPLPASLPGPAGRPRIGRRADDRAGFP